MEPPEPAPPPPPALVPVPAPSLPRLVLPWSAAGVTSRRPVFRWLRRPSSARVVVELCRERACAKPVHALPSDGEELRAPTALAAGAWWWRVRDLGEPVLVTPTWRFHVGRRDAAVTASWAPRVDVDGDGRVDPVLAIDRSALSIGSVDDVAPGRNARVFLGRAGGIGPEPALQLVAGAPVVGLGDVDGDGHCDLGAGHVVHLGAPGVLVPTPRRLPVGALVAAGGDVDRDGYADVVQASHDDTATLHLGTSAGLAAKAAVTLRVAKRGRWPLDGVLVDLDADGHADFVSVAADALLVHRGGPRGFGAEAEVLTSASHAERVLGSVASVGDVDGDGFPDVAVAEVGIAGEGAATVVVVRGGRGAPHASWLLRGTAAMRPAGSASGVGDVDGDGFDDLLLATDPFAGLLFLRGGPRGPQLPRSLTLKDGEGAALVLGDQLGDVDGDGFSDAVLGIHAPIDGTTFPALFLGGRRGLRRVGD